MKDPKDETNIKMTNKNFEKKLRQIEKKKYNERVKKEAIRRKNYERYVQNYERDVERERKRLDKSKSNDSKFIHIIFVCLLIIILFQDWILPILEAMM